MIFYKYYSFFVGQNFGLFFKRALLLCKIIFKACQKQPARAPFLYKKLYRALSQKYCYPSRDENVRVNGALRQKVKCCP